MQSVAKDLNVNYHTVKNWIKRKVVEKLIVSATKARNYGLLEVPLDLIEEWQDMLIKYVMVHQAAMGICHSPIPIDHYSVGNNAATVAP